MDCPRVKAHNGLPDGKRFLEIICNNQLLSNQSKEKNTTHIPLSKMILKSVAISLLAGCATQPGAHVPVAPYLAPYPLQTVLHALTNVPVTGGTQIS